MWLEVRQHDPHRPGVLGFFGEVEAEEGQTLLQQKRRQCLPVKDVQVDNMVDLPVSPQPAVTPFLEVVMV